MFAEISSPPRFAERGRGGTRLPASLRKHGRRGYAPIIRGLSAFIRQWSVHLRVIRANHN